MSGNIQAGLSAAKAEAMGTLQFFVNNVLVPIIGAVLVFFLIYEIASAARKHKHGEEFQDDITKIIVIVIVLALVGSFPFWGWQMIGVAGTTTASILLGLRMW